MIIDTGNMDSVVAFIVAIIMALIAAWQNRQKTVQVSALSLPQGTTAQPEVVAQLPDRSWKMSAATRQWLTFDATPENAAKINAQIDAAEAKQLTDYRIDFAGGYYLISYGTQYGGAGNPSGK